MTTLPPASRSLSIQTGIFTRWSTDCAGRSSRDAQSIIFPPSGDGTASEIPSMSGHSSSQKLIPRSRSCWSAAPNMHWLDMTLPVRISSPVLFDTTVTS